VGFYHEFSEIRINLAISDVILYIKYVSYPVLQLFYLFIMATDFRRALLLELPEIF